MTNDEQGKIKTLEKKVGANLDEEGEARQSTPQTPNHQTRGEIRKLKNAIELK